MSVFIEREFLKRITETSEAAVQAVQLQVSKDLFLDPLNKKFFEIALWYYQKYTNILTLDTLKHVLERSKIRDDERQKLLLFFSELQSSKFENRPISFLVDGLRYDFKKAQLRQILISSVSSLEQSKVDETFEIIKAGITKLELNSRADTREGFFHDSVDERSKRYLDIKNCPEKYKGVGTGWPSFDRTTGGVRGGQLMVIVAGPKEGKSCSLINITHHVCAVEMKNVLLVSIEMKKAQVERRFESRDTGLSCSKIRDGLLSLDEEKIYNHYLELQKTRPGKLYILDEPNCTSSFIKSKLTTIPIKFDLIVVDYLGILKADSRRSGEDLWETIGSAALELRNVAREFNIPVITATQANREGIKESRYKYGIENVGLSHLISAHCDTMLSLRLADRDELEVNDVVEMNAATIAVRDDKACRFTIDACFNTMTMKERELVLTDSSLPSLPVTTTEVAVGAPIVTEQAGAQDS